MKVSRQPISAVSSSYAKNKEDYCRQTTQDVDNSTETEEIHPALKNQVQDPFLYYSNDRVRKRELRHQDVKDNSSDRRSSSSSLSAQEQSTATCVRKSRITFELHPHLLLEDLDSPTETEEIHPTLNFQDPFLYYSNDRVRMPELRLQDVKDDSPDHGSSSSSLSAQEQSTTTCARKTRITFELHPHLLLEDLMKDLVDEDSFDFDVILDASLVADEQNPGSVNDDVMNGLREIYLG